LKKDRDHERSKNEELSLGMAAKSSGCWQVFYVRTMSSVEGEPLVSEILDCCRATQSRCARIRDVRVGGSDQRATPPAWRRSIRVVKWGWVEAKTIGAWSMVVRYGDEDVKASRKTWSVVCKLKRGRWAPSWLVGKNRRVRSRRVRGGCAQGLPVRGGGVKQTWSSRTRPYCFLTVTPPYRLLPPFPRSHTSSSLRNPLNPTRFLLFALYRRWRPLFVELLITFSPAV